MLVHITYPCAIAPYSERGCEEAYAWLCDKLRDDQKLSVWIPSPRQKRANDFMQGISARDGKDLRVSVRSLSQQGNGPVLAMYPSVEHLTSFVHAAGITALAIVQSEEKLDTWARQVHATVLDSEDAVAPYLEKFVAEAEPELLPEIVRELEQLTQLINHGKSIEASGYGKNFAVSALLRLHDAGIPLPAKRMAQWAVAHGWIYENPKELMNLAEKINGGIRPRIRRGF